MTAVELDPGKMSISPPILVILVSGSAIAAAGYIASLKLQASVPSGLVSGYILCMSIVVPVPLLFMCL